MKNFSFILAGLVAVLMISGCGLTKKDLGMSREGPDATLVKTNNPLILPPEYNVRPAKTAHVTTEEDSTTDE